MLTGENGILKQVQKAAKETNDVSIKEKFELLSANYKLEKAVDNNLTFKKFCEKNNEIKNIKILDENPSKDVQCIAQVENRILIVKNDGSYVLTKGNNLVSNGFLEEGAKKFTGGFEFKNGSLVRTGSSRMDFNGEELIKVDTNKKYYQAIIAKATDVSSIHCIGMVEYDIDKKEIQYINSHSVKGSLTYLERDLKDGDTEIYLDDLSGYEDVKAENDGLIFWNYEDSTGYLYPELTYSRNVYRHLYNFENSFDLENNKIILKQPWDKGTIEKGTKVSQSSEGDTFAYKLLNYKGIKEEYNCYESYIYGEANSENGSYGKFRPETKYVRILALFNINTKHDVTINLKDIIFAECE